MFFIYVQSTFHQHSIRFYNPQVKQLVFWNVHEELVYRLINFSLRWKRSSTKMIFEWMWRVFNHFFVILAQKVNSLLCGVWWRIIFV